MYMTYLKDNKVSIGEFDSITESQLEYFDIINEKFFELYLRAKEILKTDINSRYKTWEKDKVDGKRTIAEPDEELKAFMRDFVKVVVEDLHFKTVEEVFSYTEGRNPKKLLEYHQKIGNTYFLEMDIKSFYDNCTYTLVLSHLIDIYPFCFVEPNILATVIKACMLNDSLPQGAPSSPLISNIVLMWVDYKFINKNVTYTRYADNIILSSNSISELKHIRPYLETEISPFEFNDKKTKFSSKNHYNQFLGLKLNDKNQITIGHKKKQEMKAMIFNLFMDYKNGIEISKKRLQSIMGKISYYNYTEGEYVSSIIKKYEEKVGIKYCDIIDNVMQN